MSRKAIFGILFLYSASSLAGVPAQLTLAEKADHLLNRLAFGPRPGEIQKLVKSGESGLKKWIEQQMHPEMISDDSLKEKLSSLKTLTLSTQELETQFPNFDEQIKKMGLDPQKIKSNEDEKKELRKKIGEEHLPEEVYNQLQSQKLIRAVETRHQLEEVLTDFWYNHFNIDSSKGEVRFMVTSYERDVIRPHIFGKFHDLLSATAHSPAMLWYLDNYLSSGGKKGPGLNENYGRELLELHTLGVDGGYQQNDVRDAARVLTGWSIETPRINAQFKFKEGLHDRDEKIVIGHHFLAGGGQDEGEELLQLLSKSPATAKFISTKLVRYFVSDTPPSSLVNRAAKIFLKTDGDLRAVYRTIFTSPEFWSRASYRAKIKTPFQYIVSSIRALGGELETKTDLPRLLNQMGEPLYRCQPPTGYKDTAEAWVNPGALVERLNFGLALSANRVNGVYAQLPRIDVAPKTVQKHPALLVRAIESAVLHQSLSPSSKKVVMSEFERDGQVMADGEVRPLSIAKATGLILGSPEFQRR